MIKLDTFLYKIDQFATGNWSRRTLRSVGFIQNKKRKRLLISQKIKIPISYDIPDILALTMLLKIPKAQQSSSVLFSHGQLLLSSGSIHHSLNVFLNLIIRKSISRRLHFKRVDVVIQNYDLTGSLYFVKNTDIHTMGL